MRVKDHTKCWLSLAQFFCFFQVAVSLDFKNACDSMLALECCGLAAAPTFMPLFYMLSTLRLSPLNLTCLSINLSVGHYRIRRHYHRCGWSGLRGRLLNGR